MEKILKKALKSIGLFNFLSRVTGNKVLTKEQKLEKYKNVNTWNFEHQNISLVYDTSEWYSKKWFFPRYDKGRIHEPIATDIFINMIKSTDIVLDMGGHLGYFSCIAGRLAFDGHVHVFEVDPKCLSFISKNLKLNGLDNVTIHNYAVSDIEEIVKIPQNDHPSPHLIINTKTSNNYLEIESVIIDDFLTKNNIHPDFIKIDIEGAESKALNGMKKTLENGNATILVEIHVTKLRDYFDTNYKDVIKLLLNYGYTLQEIEHRSENGNMMEIDLNSELKGNTMILCTKKSTNAIEK